MSVFRKCMWPALTQIQWLPQIQTLSPSTPVMVWSGWWDLSWPWSSSSALSSLSSCTKSELGEFHKNVKRLAQFYSYILHSININIWMGLCWTDSNHIWIPPALFLLGLCLSFFVHPASSSPWLMLLPIFLIFTPTSPQISAWYASNMFRCVLLSDISQPV